MRLGVFFSCLLLMTTPSSWGAGQDEAFLIDSASGEVTTRTAQSVAKRALLNIGAGPALRSSAGHAISLISSDLWAPGLVFGYVLKPIPVADATLTTFCKRYTTVKGAVDFFQGDETKRRDILGACGKPVLDYLQSAQKLALENITSKSVCNGNSSGGSDIEYINTDAGKQFGSLYEGLKLKTRIHLDDKGLVTSIHYEVLETRSGREMTSAEYEVDSSGVVQKSIQRSDSRSPASLSCASCKAVNDYNFKRAIAAESAKIMVAASTLYDKACRALSPGQSSSSESAGGSSAPASAEGQR